MAFQISLTSNRSKIVRLYNPDGIQLDGPYEVGLKHFVFWNTMFNITPENNTLTITYQTNDYNPETNEFQTNVRHNVQLEPGFYEIDDIIDIFNADHEIIESSTHFEFLKKSLSVRVKSAREIDFTGENSIGPVLGFSKRVLKAGKSAVSDQALKLCSINTVKIHCNLIRSNIEDTKRNTHVLYDFPLDVTKIGTQIIKEPNPICYFTVNTDIIYELEIRITDQDNRLLDLQGDIINLTLDFHPLK